MIELPQLKAAIEAGWGPDTCFDANEWTPENPVRGQCVVTALVVQHFLSGELQKFDTEFQGRPESHYRNELPDSTVIDWTRQQYPADQELHPSEVNLHGFATVRDKMMHEPVTRRHYELLLGRVVQKLGL